MTNKERQKSLDKKKWLLSEKIGKDMSGVMGYCMYCKKRRQVPCNIPQSEREKDCLCARAFNSMVQITARLERGKGNDTDNA